MRPSTTLRTPLGLALASLLALLLAACGGGGGGDASDGDGDGTQAADPPAAADGAGPAEAADLDAVEVVLTEVTTDLESPIAMAVRPGHDALYVAEREGRIRVVEDGTVAEAPLLDINEETTTEVERGLLGIAFSPDGDHLYVSYTDPEGDSHLEEYAMGDGVAELDTASRRAVLEVDQPFPNHNGGHVLFGPDGHLYWGLGDGGAAGDPEGNGQDTETLLGALLRIDPRPDGDRPYGIPADNPFVDGGGRPEIWAYGLRNPWRFSFDRQTDDLWIADVGQSELEEINLVTAETGRGANFGWNLMEGTQPFGEEGSEPEGHVPPVHQYENTGERCSITGGFVYRGEAVPALQGAYVYGDYCEGQVMAAAFEDGALADERTLDIGVEPGNLVSFGEGPDGELYVLSFADGLLRIDQA